MADEFEGLNLDQGSRQERLKDSGAVVVGKQKKQIFNKVDMPSFPFANMLGFILCLLICVALIRSFYNQEPIYFSSLLEILTDTPTLNISFQIPTTFLGDWGIFNFLRDLISSSIQIINFLIFIVNGLINALSFLFFFIQGLLGLV